MFNTFTKEMIFPTAMVLLSIFSAMGYGFKGDLKLTVYWIFASGSHGKFNVFKVKR